MIKNIYWPSCNGPVILDRFETNMNFLNVFSKIAQTSRVVQIRTGGAELWHEDRWTNTQTLHSCYRAP
jgi:hypothetical protein